VPVIGFAAELPDSPEASFELGKHEITRRFQVICSTLADGPIIAANAIGIPKLFQTYVFGDEFHTYCRCRSIEPKRKAPNSAVWEVECKYSTPELKEGGGGGGGHGGGGNSTSGSGREVEGQHQNPLIELPEVSTHFESKQGPVMSVFNLTTGKIEPCKASTGEVFVPPPQKDYSTLCLTIKRNEDLLRAPHPLLSVLFQDTVNSDVFWGSAPGTVKCMSITAERQQKQLADGSIFPFIKATYQFRFRDSWDLQILDTGSYYIVPGNPSQLPENNQAPKKLIAKGEDGHPIPVLLDGKGGKLAEGKDPVYQVYRVYQWQPFGILNLPQSFLEVQ